MEKLQVLIIDDDREIAEFFSTVLTLEDMSCDIVLSAKDALKHLAASVPDLVLLDMRLGQEIGGEDILYQIRSNPRYDHTRVVVITAYPAIAEMVTNVADMILIKPVEWAKWKCKTDNCGQFKPLPCTAPTLPIKPSVCLRYFLLDRRANRITAPHTAGRSVEGSGTATI